MTEGAPLLTRAEIAAVVAELGAAIAADHPDGVVLVGVLKGAAVLLADLARAVRGVPVEVECIAISRFAPDSGRVRILHDVGIDLTGRDVVLVEDLVDTGLTADFLVRTLRDRGECSLNMLSAVTGLSRSALQRDAEVFLLQRGYMKIEGQRKLSVAGSKAISEIDGAKKEEKVQAKA